MQLPLQTLHIDPSLLNLRAHYRAVLALDLDLHGIVLGALGRWRRLLLLILHQLVLALHLLNLNDDVLLDLYLPIELVLQLLDVSVLLADDVILEEFVHFLGHLGVDVEIGAALQQVLLRLLHLLFEVLE